MPLRHRSLVVLLFVLLIAGCQRATPEQCNKLCWRFNELNYWERFETETKLLAPKERDELRIERQKEWDEMRARQFDPGLDNCVRECRKGASDDDVACVDRAKTAEAARACLAED